ncbi:MAG: hydrogenase-4 component G [Desulfobacter sp.]|nr:hydrogenase-4 component G [Desulfobacter sp.]WDP86433.1 MAG: hydrogenase-4 component G [Desulfobacter sp.]
MVSFGTSSSITSSTNYHLLQPRTGKMNSKNKISVSSQLIEFTDKGKTNTHRNIGDQNAIFHFNRLSPEQKASLTYQDMPISDLSTDQAKALLREDGYFGVDKTSQRIIDFVITGAGDDLDRLKAGRKGVLQGFKAAEKAWGGKLPDISYETLAKSLETIDEKIQKLGGSILDLSA